MRVSNDAAPHHLMVLDVDSTLTSTEGIDILAELVGVGDQVSAITAAAMRGELDFAASLRERVKLLQGLPMSSVCAAVDRVWLTPGAETLISGLRERGWLVGAVSGGFTTMVGPIAFGLGLDHYRANTLEQVNGVLTGRLVGPIIDRAAKAEALREWASQAGLPLSCTVAVGDGANDLDMIATAGLGIAFHAKPAVAAASDFAIPDGGLEQILDLVDQWVAQSADA
jgi:phosphoserine phosphatase